MGATAQAPPPGRYGPTRPGRPRAWKTWAYTAIALIIASVAAYVAYSNFGSEPISTERLSFEETSEHAMEITFRVSRDEPERPAVCIVRVRDSDGAEGGRKEVYVGPSDGEVVQTAVIRSGGRPVTADAYACSYDVPEYLGDSGESGAASGRG